MFSNPGPGNDRLLFPTGLPKSLRTWQHPEEKRVENRGFLGGLLGPDLEAVLDSCFLHVPLVSTQTHSSAQLQSVSYEI